MINWHFSQIRTWRIPAGAVATVLSELATDGRAGNEGVVLFLGPDKNSAAVITHLVMLRGPGIVKRPAQIRINAEIFNDVTDAALKNKVRLLGQVHSHGPQYPLDLSPTDRICGVKFPNYLSIVAPDYGMTAAPIRKWGVHVFSENDGYVRLSRAEAQRRIHIVQGLPYETLIVGGGYGS